MTDQLTTAVKTELRKCLGGIPNGFVVEECDGVTVQIMLRPIEAMALPQVAGPPVVTCGEPK